MSNQMTPDERWAEINRFTTPEQIIEDYRAIAGWSRFQSSNPEKNRDEAWLIAAINQLRRADMDYLLINGDHMTWEEKVAYRDERLSQ